VQAAIRAAEQAVRYLQGPGVLSELGDAPVGEPVVGAGGLQPFLQGAVLDSELKDALLESDVLGGDPLRGLLGPFVFQTADLIIMLLVGAP
jgi:hypothetical protein